MISLISGLLKWLFSKNEVHILMLGLDGAGKTTFLEHAKTMLRRRPTSGNIQLDRIPPTVGLNIARLDIDNTRVIIWDLGGQSILRSIWTKYYSEANGLIFVVDSCSSPERLAEARETLQSLLNHNDLLRIPFILCANKQDAVGALSPNEVDKIVNFTRNCANERVNYVQGMSALSGIGIEEALQWIVNAATLLGPRKPLLSTD